MPGVRDQHTGCVAEYLVKEDLFDFLLLSLPDNDAYSHKHGPHAQVESIAAADRQMVRMMDAAGGIEAFLEDHAVIVAADHSHAGVERVTHLHEAFADFTILQPSTDNADDAEIAVCPAQRSAGIYALVEEGLGALLPRLVRTARQTAGVDLTMWRTSSGEGAIAAAIGELRFSPGSDVVDRRGGRWSVEGDLDVIGARVEDGLLVSTAYPDALGRAWSALTAPTSGDILLSAAPGYEFADWGGQAHVGGGSHGSLHASDSLGVLAWCGTGPDTRDVRAEWTLRDIAPDGRRALRALLTLATLYAGARWRFAGRGWLATVVALVLAAPAVGATTTTATTPRPRASPPASRRSPRRWTPTR